jgi:membrane protease YdiL (CAAX protease family)
MSATTTTERPGVTLQSPESFDARASAPRPRNLITRHPVLSFYALAFAISWGGMLLVIGGPGNFPGTSAQVDRLFLSVMLTWLAGPSVASIAMTGLLHGKAGYRVLLAHLFRWRVGARWYAAALLAAPLMYVALACAMSLTSAEWPPGILVTSDRSALLVMGLAYGLLGGGFLEELGWTGFAVPTLRQHYGALRTGLIAGLLWGAYHFSVIFWSGSHSGALGLAILLAQLFAWLPAYRILMVWVYDRTESLLVAMLMHASLTAGMLILQPVEMAGVRLLVWLLVFSAAWWLVVGVVAVARGQRSRRRAQPMRALSAATTAVQNAQRLAFTGILLKHSGHSRVGAGAGGSGEKRATRRLIGSTAK